MTRKSKERTEDLPIAVYKGVPNKLGEQNRWQMFLTWFCPWLNRKRKLGDEFLESEVRKRNAEAEVMEADARLKQAQAEKTAAETAEIAVRLERKKLASDISIKNLKHRNELQEQKLKELEEKLNRLRIIHGGKILYLDEGDDKNS